MHHEFRHCSKAECDEDRADSVVAVYGRFPILPFPFSAKEKEPEPPIRVEQAKVFEGPVTLYLRHRARTLPKYQASPVGGACLRFLEIIAFGAWDGLLLAAFGDPKFGHPKRPLMGVTRLAPTK